MIAVPHVTSLAAGHPGGVDACGVDGPGPAPGCCEGGPAPSGGGERRELEGPLTPFGTGFRWTLTRNCSLSPRATAKAYALLCGVSLVIALGWFAVGYGVVLLFCGLELLAVGAALLVWGRRVGEGEVVSVHANTLRIERCRGTARAHVELPLAWTRVIEEDARVLLACGTRRVAVGAQVDWPRRQRFAQELRRALAMTSATPMHAPT